MFSVFSSKKSNLIAFIFIIGILISIIYAAFNVNNFDKNEDTNHLMIRGDILLVWKEAEVFKKDLIENKKVFGNGIEYTRTFLPSKIIALYSIICKNSLFEEYQNIYDDIKIKIGGKFFFLLFQIIIYYSSLIYLYKRLLIFYKKSNISFFTVAYLALDPNILQWHGTFWVESIFISLLIIFIAMLIKIQKNLLFCLFIGIFLGLLYLQKTTTIFFIFFVVPYIFFSEQTNKIQKCISIILGLIIVLSFLSYDNFKKTERIYFMPMQTKDAYYMSLVPTIYNTNGMIEEYKRLKTDEENWKKENKYYDTDFNWESEFALAEYRKDKALEIIFANKITTIKIYLKNSIAHMVINPFQTFFWHKYNQKRFQNEEFHLSEESKKYFIFKLIYSLFFYLIILFGLINVLKDKKKFKFHILLLFFVAYLIFMLGWVGNSRYFIPSIIFLSIFFGHGLDYIRKLKK